MDRHSLSNHLGQDGGGADSGREQPLGMGRHHSGGLSSLAGSSNVQFDGLGPDLTNISPINVTGNSPVYRPPWSSADPSLVNFLPSYGGWTSYPTDEDTNVGQQVPETVNVSPTSISTAFLGSEDYFRSLSQPDSSSTCSTESGRYTSRARSHSEHFDVLGGITGVDFTNLAQGGRDLYTESLQQWHESTPDTKTYDPFKTTHVLQEPVEISMPNQTTNYTKAKPAELLHNAPGTPAAAFDACDHKAKSKLSYSEVAKNRPPDYKPSHVNKDSPPVQVHTPFEGKPGPSLPEGFPDFTGIKVNKYHGKARSAKACKVKKRPILEPTPIKPDSRYGLDSFEEPVHSTKSCFSDHHSGSSGSTPQSRKGSTSSGTSSYCGVEEIDLPETFQRTISTDASYDVADNGSHLWSELKFDGRKGPAGAEKPEGICDGNTACKTTKFPSDKHDDVKRKTELERTEVIESKRARSSSSSTELTSNTKSSSAGKPPLFFDPKRIFNTKPKSNSKPLEVKVPGTQRNFTNNQEYTTLQPEHHIQSKGKQSEAENILNNDKPKTKQNSNISRSCYINNDLRESPSSSKKQTNSDLQRDAGLASGHSENEASHSQRGSSQNHGNRSSTRPKHRSGSASTREDNCASIPNMEPQSDNTQSNGPKLDSCHNLHAKGSAKFESRGSSNSRADTKGPTSRSELRGSARSDGRTAGHPRADSKHSGTHRPDHRSGGFQRTESRGPGLPRHNSRAESRPSSRDDLPPRRKVGDRRNQSDWDQQYMIGDLIIQLWHWLMWAGQELGHVVWNITKLTISIGLALLLMLAQYTMSSVKSIWIVIETKVFRKQHTDSKDEAVPKMRAGFGLKENIALPSTGDDAMKRLLAEKGKDPYSILGVKADVSDEVLKKYYRKQAVLVHPDKNQMPGAEEAFKILGHAFDIIGEPEKRKQFDSQRLEAQEEEEAMHKFSDLLTKLHDKMQEASNLMRCENCGGKHRRVPTDRPMYAARYCQKCDYNHPVREGDVWAESHMLGFLWNYYACMENRVHDITEWASCQSDRFKHIQANAHNVVYRIATNTNTGGRHRQPANHRGATNEADLEDFLSHLFHQTAGGSPQATGAGATGPGPFTGDGMNYGQTRTGAPSWNQSSSGSGTNKKTRRKKKRH